MLKNKGDADVDDEILEMSLPKRPESSTAPPPKTFKPWHKPRKQWVRKFQWQAEVERLIQQSHFPDGSRIFRYLGLPGEDLLDIKVLHSVCSNYSLELRYIGINDVHLGSPDDIQLNLTENEIKNMNGINEGSEILRERFESIANEKSLVFDKMRTNAPYHVINMDLCSCVVRQPYKQSPTYIDALTKIIRSQMAHAQSWVLFLTTRVGSEMVPQRNLKALVKAIIDNVRESEDFKENISAILCAEGENILSRLQDANGLPADKFKDLFCIGFGKWLLSYIRSATPKCKLTLGKSCYYSVHRGNPDMISLVFRCDVIHIPPTDIYQLAKENNPAPHVAEVSMALELLKNTGLVFNLDAKMETDSDLNEEMIAESEALLRQAHYPVDHPERGYRMWIESLGREG